VRNIIGTVEWVTHIWSALKLHNVDQPDPCGGGIEYLHRDPASLRGRRKGKSQMLDSKIWSQVPRDSDPRKTALAAYTKDRPDLSSERTPHKNKTVTVTHVIKIWS
jgi:hypothetical protein